MKLEYFPSCCTMKIISQFGGTSTCDHLTEKAVTMEEMEEQIQELIEYAVWNGDACLTATTNTEQIVANKVLLKMGFKHTKWMSKQRECWTKVRMWWLAING